MYKIYLIVTFVGTALFLLAYFPANKARVEREKARLEAVEQRAREEEERRRADEEAARRSDRERREAREREDAEREAKIEADEQAKNTQLQASTERIQGEIVTLKAQLEERRSELDKFREARLALQKDVFDAKKANELSRIQLRTAQLETQRALDMVAARVGGNPTVLLPPPAAAPAPRN
jgi:hypothetical protein